MNCNAEVVVSLGRRSYDIRVQAGGLRRIGELCKQRFPGSRIAVVTNEKIWNLHGWILEESLKEAGMRYERIAIPDGEASKSLSVAESVYGALIDAGFERGDPLLAFGGGVVGDLAGFVAATYLRGVPLVHVPTTLLAQVDSSIGGKTALNHPKGKNMIGVFYQPAFVVSDVEVLRTLGQRELKDGLAEAIKYGFIWQDGPLSFIEDNVGGLLSADASLLEPLVAECARIKARIVEIDERDKDLRAILNYGHTFGHALEIATDFAYSHGEAIAIGMSFAAELASKLGMIDGSLAYRHKRVLEEAGLPTKPEEVDIASIIRAISVDKKRRLRENYFVLLEGLGKPVVRAVPEDTIIELIVETIGRTG